MFFSPCSLEQKSQVAIAYKMIPHCDKQNQSVAISDNECPVPLQSCIRTFVWMFHTHTQSHTLAQNARMRANADTHSLGALEEGRRQGMRRERSSGTTPTLMLPKQNQPGREGTQTAKTGKREGQGDGRLKHNNAKHGFSRYCSDRQRRCYELIVTN